MVTRTPRPLLYFLLAAVLVAAAASAAVSGRFAADSLRRRAAFILYVPPLRQEASGTSLPISLHGGLIHAVVSATGKILQFWWVRGVLFAYIVAFLLFTFSHRAQTWVIYLHCFVHRRHFSARNLCRHGLAGFARGVEAGNLRGWHLLPTGPPFAQCEADFDERLKESNARVIIFFHGNGGTRAFPPKRVRVLHMLASHFRAHVFSFDYSGFGDSEGRPSETQLYADARVVYAFVRARVSADSKIVLYGQSLGTFAAVDLAAYLSLPRVEAHGVSVGAEPVAAVILEAPPASLTDAARSHPTAAPFRIIPGVDVIFRNLLKERLDSLAKVGNILYPLLVLHGREDGFIPLSQGLRLFERAKNSGNDNAHLVVFSECGHVNVAAQRTYLSTVHEFLERHAPFS